jgi:hypothetical protein
MNVLLMNIGFDLSGVYSSPVQIIRNAHSIPHLLKAKRKSKLGPSRVSMLNESIWTYDLLLVILFLS